MKKEMSEQAKRDFARYQREAHAMQSGVAMKMNYDAKDMEPKHLRVGVNSAMVDSSALAGLLIEKGIITEDEYAKALADGMQRERENYERELADRLGKKVTLR